MKKLWFDDQFDNTFRRLSDRFFAWDDVFEKNGDKIQTYGPYFYGYQMTVGPDGKPIVKEYGNVRPNTALTNSDIREPFVDTIVDKDSKSLKLVAEMPGIEKSDIQVTVEGNTVNISAERNNRKYHTQVPIQQKVDANSAKAKYDNGILELTLALIKEEPKGKKVLVE